MGTLTCEDPDLLKKKPLRRRRAAGVFGVLRFAKTHNFA